MPASTENRKYYLRAPDLEFRRDGPIKIGNVLTDMTEPQDPITVLDLLPNIIPGSTYSKGKMESTHHASGTAGLSAKLYDIFGGQAEAKSNWSMRTVYDFDEVSALYLEKNPTEEDAKRFYQENEVFRSALRHGPVYIVTGLKIAKGLRYSNQRKSQRKAAVSGEAHVTEDIAVSAKLDGDRGVADTDTWTVLGDAIIAYRLHIVKKKGWLWNREASLTARSYNPGQLGALGGESDRDDFEMHVEEILSEHVDSFSMEQNLDQASYLDVEDEEEEWSLAVLDVGVMMCMAGQNS